MKLKSCIAVLAVLCLLAAPVVSLAAEKLSVPDGKQTIYTEWKLWNDGIPVSIKDGGTYSLGKGKTGTSITISGLSALAVKSNGEVYKYSPKKNSFERMKNAKKEPEKDQIRLVFEASPENRPFSFNLPVQSLFPNVAVVFDGIMGKLAEHIHLEVKAQGGSVSVWNDRYQVEYPTENEKIRAQYDPAGKLIEAEYSLKRGQESDYYVYRRKAIAYGKYEIVPDEIGVYRNRKKTLICKDGSLQPDAEEIVGKDFDYDPCKIIGGTVSVDIPFDPDDTSWKVHPGSGNAIHGELPALTAAPWLPEFIRQEIIEDDVIQLTVDGMYYWGLKEEELCEWTRADKWDWRISGDGEGDRLMTMKMPASAISTLFRTELKDGTQLKVYYLPYNRELQMIILDGETEYTINNLIKNKAEIKFKLEDGRSVSAVYDLRTGCLDEYYLSLNADGKELYYGYSCNIPSNPGVPVLSHLECWEGEQESYYYFNYIEWVSVDTDTMDETICGTLPEGLAEMCVPVPVIYD